VAVVTRQRVEKERETLSKGSVGRIVIQPSSISNEFGQERFAPRDHVARSWPEMLKFAEEGALTVTALHNLFITLRKDVDRFMEHLGLGRRVCEFELQEGTKNCGPCGVKGKGPCGEASGSQPKVGQEAVSHRQKLQLLRLPSD
jgi:hypothetical protein